ncbi:uncharacterized protein LOC129217023 isoform X2 [Uloborus diversus]|nr:uncharacterized protein LOC129217023 isoform X2 [Uloborus diversus]
MAVLESLQERLMRAIDDVNKHLTPTKQGAQAISHSSEKISAKEVASSRSSSSTVKTELSKSDSLNKDSGIGASESSLLHTEPCKSSEENDELLQLLDLIDQKSLVLLQQVEGSVTPEKASQKPEMNEHSNNLLLDNLLFEKVDTQRQLSEVRAERDELKSRLAKLELATEAVMKEKLKVQQQLDASLTENRSLHEKIQIIGDSKFKAETQGFMVDIEKANVKRKYLQFSEKSRRRVSSILKETNVLELQKQLLTYVMENDILRAKLEQNEPSRMANWLKVESRLKAELKDALEAKQSMQETLERRNLEIASLKDRIRALEEPVDNDSCVKNFGMSSTEDWREPGIANAYNKRSNLNAVSPYSPLGYGDFSKTQSLPAMLLTEAQAKSKLQQNEPVDYGHVYDTGSFTDIPLNSSYQPEQPFSHSSHTTDHSKDLVDFSTPTGPNYSSASTLVQSPFAYQPTLNSGLSVPNLSGQSSQTTFQNWGFASRKTSAIGVIGKEEGAKLVNGHLCWKGAKELETRDISSICTEFDPLSDDAPSCENFVDSLNLSIPLKPSQLGVSQLSSIGDSLHSASLDIGCATSGVLCQDTRKISNARSVDGIRELLVDSGYFKRPASSPYTHSNVVMRGKTGRQLPVNIMNCMHEVSDYSLL